MKKFIILLFISQNAISQDTSINVPSKTFDYLLNQNLKAQKYEKDNSLLLLEKSMLSKELMLKDSVIISSDKLTAIKESELMLCDKQLINTQSQLNTSNKKVKQTKFVCVLIGISETVLTIFYIIKH
jgi:hypothetical protein